MAVEGASGFDVFLMCSIVGTCVAVRGNDLFGT
jgi:hypothetical protein